MNTRIVSSVALAAVIALGATGCSLIAHQGTLTPYAPSDGIDANADAVEVRNLLLVISEENGEISLAVGGDLRRGLDGPGLAVELRRELVAATGSPKEAKA